jgi:hypothetical protein
MRNFGKPLGTGIHAWSIPQVPEFSFVALHEQASVAHIYPRSCPTIYFLHKFSPPRVDIKRVAIQRPFYYISISISFYFSSYIQEISLGGMQVANMLKN